MKGLLIKDLKILLGQKKFLSVVIAFSVFFMFTNENPYSGVGYLTMLLTIFTLSTISYDEYDNGMAFLMTLPISRKTYVREKYVFSGLTALLAAIASVILSLVAARVMNITLDMVELIGIVCIMILLAWLVLAVMIPMQIKFGAEKGRIAMMLAMGAIFAIVLLLAKGLGSANLEDVVSFLAGLSPVTLVHMSVFAVFLVLLASYLICVRIILKKEY